MKQFGILVVAVMVSDQAASTADRTMPQRGSVGAPIVEVIGCLLQGPDSTWILGNGTSPAISKLPNTTTAAVKEAVSKPLGSRQYRLLGTAPFSPETHKGEKVVVKGVLIEAPKNDRLNVTSLQTTGASCGGK
jgi:hypothetical protein